MKAKNIDKEVELPEGVEVAVEGRFVKVSGPKGELELSLRNSLVELIKEDRRVKVIAKKIAKRQKTDLNTFVAHLKNAIKSVQEGHTYRLKICSGHFPMNVSSSGKEFVVKNLFGEKVPRMLKLKEGVDVKVDGEIVTVTGNNKAITGQVAADIEQLTRRPGYDHRIFQDGIYIIEKDGKELR